MKMLTERHKMGPTIFFDYVSTWRVVIRFQSEPAFKRFRTNMKRGIGARLLDTRS